MNTANNKRKRQSIEKIEKVFIDLLQTKELSEIHVSDICKQAQLNRTTFYANYTDVYDLADSIRDKLENDLLAIGFNSNDYLKLFRHIRENQLFYRTYFKLGYDDNYKILVYDTELAKKHFQNRFIDYHIEFFKSGLNKIIKMWLQNGCQESPEEMFEIIKCEYQGREIFFQSPTDH